MYFAYILKSQRTDKFYVGHCENLDQRLIQHNNGYSKSTKSGRPWNLVYSEIFESRSEAMKRELEIKNKKSRSYILKLIETAHSVENLSNM